MIPCPWFDWIDGFRRPISLHRITGTLALAGTTIALLFGTADAQLLPPGNIPGSAPPGVQGQRPGAGASDTSTCVRLEGALAQLDSASNATPDTARRYEDAINRQRYELDQTIVQSRRQGCDQGGGFFTFGAPRSPQCTQLDEQIKKMRSNMDRMTSELGTMRGGSDMNRDLQRRQLVSQLSQNNCGPQYRTASQSQPPRQRGLLETLFGGGNEESTWQGGAADMPSSSTFRTMCVRTCDGYFFPISYATVPSRFGEDERTCKQLCPASEASLFVHRNPGEEIAQAVSIGGQPYSETPNAFKYRQAFNSSCSCRAPGQSWADALGVDRDQTLQQGDIIVTEQRAKQMSQPRAVAGKSQTQFSAPPSQAQSPGGQPKDQAKEEAKEEAPLTPIPAGRVRVVGPLFYPVR